MDQLVELKRRAVQYARRDGLLAGDDPFYAEQNARTVKNAAECYRTMFGGQVSSWNLRDRHMVETLEALAEHLSHQRSSPARIVVWEHNSHLGDARGTEAALRGELSVGQLVRQAHPDDCCLLGFTTYTGTVTAADDWGGPVMRKAVRARGTRRQRRGHVPPGLQEGVPASLQPDAPGRRHAAQGAP
ncbi:erythromycin esterase family protein [Streptomyces sp. 900105755]